MVTPPFLWPCIIFYTMRYQDNHGNADHLSMDPLASCAMTVEALRRYRRLCHHDEVDVGIRRAPQDAVATHTCVPGPSVRTCLVMGRCMYWVEAISILHVTFSDHKTGLYNHHRCYIDDTALSIRHKTLIYLPMLYLAITNIEF